MSSCGRRCCQQEGCARFNLADMQNNKAAMLQKSYCLRVAAVKLSNMVLLCLMPERIHEYSWSCHVIALRAWRGRPASKLSNITLTHIFGEGQSLHRKESLRCWYVWPKTP